MGVDSREGASAGVLFLQQHNGSVHQDERRLRPGGRLGEVGDPPPVQDHGGELRRNWQGLFAQLDDR